MNIEYLFVFTPSYKKCDRILRYGNYQKTRFDALALVNLTKEDQIYDFDNTRKFHMIDENVYAKMITEAKKQQSDDRTWLYDYEFELPGEKVYLGLKLNSDTKLRLKNDDENKTWFERIFVSNTIQVHTNEYVLLDIANVKYKINPYKNQIEIIHLNNHSLMNDHIEDIKIITGKKQGLRTIAYAQKLDRNSLNVLAKVIDNTYFF